MPADWSFVSVDLELTNHCNINCLMCPRKAITRPEGFMPNDAFDTVSEKLISEGSLITFSGMGDPLSHPKVFEWIDRIRRNGGNVGIVVNPASLNEETSQRLVEAQPNSITVSFPSIRRDVFERLCPTISYVDALKLSLILAELSRGNVGLRVAGIMTEVNRNEYREFNRFWKKHNVNSSVTTCHGRGGNLKVSEIYQPHSAGLGLNTCGLFQFHTFITWEGDVLSCCHDLSGITKIGNLVNDAVSAIVEMKRKAFKNAMPFPVCRKCDEPLRQYHLPEGSPPQNKKERIHFFRSIRSTNRRQ